MRLGFSKNWASGPSWDYFMTYRKVWNLRKMISAFGNRGINIALKASNCFAGKKEVTRFDLLTSWLQVERESISRGVVKIRRSSKFLVALKRKFKKIAKRLLSRAKLRVRRKVGRKIYYFNTVPKMFAPCHIADITVRFSATGLNVRVFFVSMFSRKKIWYYKRNKKRNKHHLRHRGWRVWRLRRAKKQLLLLLQVRNALESVILRDCAIPCDVHLHNFFQYRQGAKVLAVSQRTLPDNNNNSGGRKKRVVRKKPTLKQHAALSLAQAFFIGNPWLVAQLIAFRFEKTQKHYPVLHEMFRWLRHLKVLSYNIIGIQVLICGKLGANTQTQFKYLTLGRSIYTQTLAARLRYGYAEAETFTGTFGIHIWFLQGKLLRF